MRFSFVLLFVSLVLPSLGGAQEPNNSFFDSTFLAPGVLSVSDDLEVTDVFPDTLLGSRDSSGLIDMTDDDSSSLGDGLASALFDVPVNDDTISFAVSGFGDDDFIGQHLELGAYEAIVTVYDESFDVLDVFSFDSVLEPGIVDEFSFSDPSYLDGAYDVEIDNTIGGVGGDVDFFTFTGLTPGDPFTARTVDTNDQGIDTIMGWFDESGSPMDQNDDAGDNTLLSRIEGVVPFNGEVTIAVTAFDDFDFIGFHNETWFYDLELTIGLPGDYNGDGTVDAADYTVWRDNDNGLFTEADYSLWADNFGASGPAVSIPEPTAMLLAAIGMGCTVRGRATRT